MPFSDLVDGKYITWGDVPEHIRNTPVNTLTTACIPVANLRFLADQILNEPKSESNIHLVKDLIERCKATDLALVEWLSAIPSSWGCVAIEREKMKVQRFGNLTPELCPWLNQCLVYRDVWVAKLHNTYFMFRALLQSIILRCGFWMGGVTITDLTTDGASLVSDWTGIASEFVQTREELLTTFCSICGSVSFLLGATPDVESFPDLQLPFRCQASELGPPLLIRPLSVAQSVIVAPKYQRSWVESVLGVVGTSYGVGIARVMAAQRFKGQPLFSR